MKLVRLAFSDAGVRSPRSQSGADVYAERHDTVGEQADRVVAFARSDGECRFDAAGGGGEVRGMLHLIAGSDHAGERVDPEGAFERALRIERAFHAIGDDAGRVGLGAGAVARGDE